MLLTCGFSGFFQKLIPAMIVTIARCAACTVVYTSVPVGPDFQVEVEDQGRPVQGLRVEIRGYPSADNRAVSNTDGNGVAAFRNLRPGSYHVSTDHDNGFPNGAEVEVKRGGPTNVTVHLKWPSIAPIAARSLKGIMRGPDYVPGQSPPRLSLDLLEGVSGRLLKSVQTTDNGEFSLEGVESGLYFLSLKPSGLGVSSGEPMIAVLVDHDATTDHLDLDLGSTSCGLWYLDRSKCPQPDLNIGQLSGQVVDAAGAAIRGATILLFDHQTVVEQLQSDRVGKFASAHSFAGTYELAVSAPGFTSLRRTAHAEFTDDSARRSFLTVQLGVAGSCSAVEVQ